MDVVFRATHDEAAEGFFDHSMADPALSQSLLVCSDAVIRDRREALIRLMAAYKRRVDYELDLSPRERLRYSVRRGFEMDLFYFEGFNLPQPDATPTIDIDSLNQLQDLLVRYEALDAARPVVAQVDNSLMEEALGRVEAEGLGNYPASQLRVLPGSPSARLIAVLDTDGDGVLSYKEFRTISSKDNEPSDHDQNEDGTIDEAEVREMLLSVSPLTDVNQNNNSVAAGDTAPQTKESIMDSIRRYKRWVRRQEKAQ